MRNNFYVYLYWRLDINEPFYVGKGTGDRCYRLNKRSSNFTRIINKVPVAVEILKDNLTEEESFYWEEKIINDMVFEYGYSINIKGNRSKEQALHLVNNTWGGEGASGCNPFDNMSKETKELWLEAHKESNPFLGKHHSKESREKISKANKGKNNSFYGKHHSQETKDKLMNENGKKIIGINVKDGYIVEFDSIREAHRHGFNRSCIMQCLNPNGNQNKHKGYIWRYKQLSKEVTIMACKGGKKKGGKKGGKKPC